MPAPSRQSDALSRRRSELSAALTVLDGGHRARLRSELALVRLGAEAELRAAHGDLRSASLPWIMSRQRRSLPGLLGPAVAGATAKWLARTGSRAAAVVARSQGSVDGGSPGGPVGVRSPFVNPPIGPGALPRPPAPAGLLAAAVHGGGAGAVRAVLVLAAGAPALGLTAAGARPLLPLAAGAALALVVAVALRQRAALDRERWSAWVDAVLRQAEGAAGARLAAGLIVLEQQAGARLDARVAARRTAVARELRALGPGEGTDDEH